MIFTNMRREIFTWINPDIKENHVKIYLPHTHEGELAMIRSILTYFKLWLKCDYSLLTDIKSLSELSFKLEGMKFRPSDSFKPKSPEREFPVYKKSSVNGDNPDIPQRQEEGRNNLLADHKSMKDVMGRSPGKEEIDSSNFLSTSLSNKLNSPLKFTHHYSAN